MTRAEVQGRFKIFKRPRGKYAIEGGDGTVTDRRSPFPVHEGKSLHAAHSSRGCVHVRYIPCIVQMLLKIDLLPQSLQIAE
jgi:hypothetical protein